MNVMEDALRRSGVHVPCYKERIWRIIKDATPRGGVTYNELIRQLSAIKAGSISCSLSSMLKRGMIDSKEQAGGVVGRPRFIYTTQMERYELLDMLDKKAKVKRTKQETTPAAVAQATRPEPQPAPTQVDASDAMMANMVSLGAAWMKAGGDMMMLQSVKVSDLLRVLSQKGVVIGGAA